jgi:hypothetical protein
MMKVVPVRELSHFGVATAAGAEEKAQAQRSITNDFFYKT